MVFDPLVESAIIGLIGVVIGIGGYSLQNWQVKKAERERAEYVIKRDKYESWIKCWVEARFLSGQKKEVPNELGKAMDEVNGMLLLYGSDDVIKSVRAFWENPDATSNELFAKSQKIILAMRKDIKDTNLGEEDMKLIRVSSY